MQIPYSNMAAIIGSLLVLAYLQAFSPAAADTSCSCSVPYQPVCASDSRTYPNTCELNCENLRRAAQNKPALTIINNGPCSGTGCYCPPQYSPVCASNSVTFNNTCLLGCENQKRASQVPPLPALTIINNGPCFSCLCPTVVDPVCGTDGKNYSTPCDLECENKRRATLNLPPIQIAYKGVCITCTCTTEYKPVCASDGYTYPNNCTLGCENKKRAAAGLPPLTVQYNGPCACVCSCPSYYQPVCGTDYRTYWNYCYLQCNDQCNVRNGYPRIFFVKYGYC